MDLYELIKTRRTVRSFNTSRAVEEHKLLRIIDAGQWAPSACNRQLWEFVVVTQPELKEKLVDQARAVQFLKHAPVVLFVLYPQRINPERQANVQSAAAAIQNMLLAAHGEGLAGAWLTNFGNDRVVRGLLNIPHSYLIVAGLALGYPDRIFSAPPRRDLSRIIHREVFQSKRGVTLSVFPDEWDEAALRDHRLRGIRAAHPLPDAFDNISDPEFTEQARIIADNLSPGMKLLDVLSFSGSHLLSLVLTGAPVLYHACDVSDQIGEFIVERKRALNISTELEFRAGDLYEIPWSDNSFDVVTCLQKIERVPDGGRLLSELKRVLKNEGQLFLSFSNRTSLKGLSFNLQAHVLRNMILGHQGPFRPLRLGVVREMLHKTGFTVQERFGVKLLPSGLSGRLKGLDGFVSAGQLGRICQVILLKCIPSTRE